MGETKTNAMRVLDREHISYDVVLYDCEVFTDAAEASKKSGIPLECTFKTLVAQGKSEKYCIIVVPGAEEVDLKKAAKALGEKSIELIPVKDINKVTGYVRGGCSPLGVKRVCKTVIDSYVNDHEKIYVSGGKIGCIIGILPKDLIDVSHAVVDSIVLERPQDRDERSSTVFMKITLRSL